MLVMPAPGLKVRDPKNPKRHVEPGEDVPENDLDWHRLIACGDLVPFDGTAPEPAPAPAPVSDSEA